MIITKKHAAPPDVPARHRRDARAAAARRHGAGVRRDGAARRRRPPRFGVVYVPNGVNMRAVDARRGGRGFELTPILEPLAPFRDQHARASAGSTDKPAVPVPGEGIGDHARAVAAWLTGVAAEEDRRRRTSEPASRWIRLPRRSSGKETQLASLELALESTELRRRVRRRLQLRLHQHDLAGARRRRRCRWRTIRARCSSGCSATATAPIRRRALARDRGRTAASSIRSTDEVARLQRALGRRRPRQADRVSRRRARRRAAHPEGRGAERARAAGGRAARGHPGNLRGARKLMFDLQVLAYQTRPDARHHVHDGRELSPPTYPEIGVPDAHHALSHHAERSGEAREARQDQHLPHAACSPTSSRSSQTTPDGDGTLLDHSIIAVRLGHERRQHHTAHGSADVLVAGGAAVKGGRHLRCPKDTPLTNLQLTLLDKSGCRVEQLRRQHRKRRRAVGSWTAGCSCGTCRR